METHLPLAKMPPFPRDVMEFLRGQQLPIRPSKEQFLKPQPKIGQLCSPSPRTNRHEGLSQISPILFAISTTTVELLNYFFWWRRIIRRENLTANIDMNIEPSYSVPTFYPVGEGNGGGFPRPCHCHPLRPRAITPAIAGPDGDRDINPISLAGNGSFRQHRSPRF